MEEKKTVDVHGVQIDKVDSPVFTNTNSQDQINKEAMEILTTLQKANTAENTVTISEFLQYIPLFNREYVNSLSDAESKQLGKAYTDRFKRHRPVTIVDDNDRSKVIVTMPSIFCDIPLLNEHKDLKDKNLTAYLADSILTKSPVNDVTSAVGRKISEAYIEMGGRDNLKEQNKLYRQQLENFTAFCEDPIGYCKRQQNSELKIPEEGTQDPSKAIDRKKYDFSGLI
ncbi:MAG: hypothetical protein GY804_09240 [Alphaproteobacteria bacterium]|nr:hypothetical protein [Alphaproteobacteria bacterium]